MEFGEYIKNLRMDKDLSQRQLQEFSGVSNTEISRIESGKRITPSAEILKKLAPYLGVSYGELLTKAGYLSEEINHEKYLEQVFRTEDGELIDIARVAKDIQEKDSELFVIMNRVTSELNQGDIDAVKQYAEYILSKGKNK